MPQPPNLTVVPPSPKTAGDYAAEALFDLFRDLAYSAQEFRRGRKPGIPGTLKVLNETVQTVLRSHGSPQARGEVAASLIEARVREAYRMPA